MNKTRFHEVIAVYREARPREKGRIDLQLSVLLPNSQMMVASTRNSSRSARSGYTRVLDTRRVVSRVDRVLTNDDARRSRGTRENHSGGHRGRDRFAPSERGFRSRKNASKAQTLGKAYRSLSSESRSRAANGNTAAAQAGLIAHVASGGPVRGRVRFDYPINIGGQPRQVEGELVFEAAIQDGQPFVTIPLAENITLNDAPSRTYRPTDRAELDLIASPPDSEEKISANAPQNSSGISQSPSIPEQQLVGTEGSTSITAPSAEDPPVPPAMRGRFSMPLLTRQTALAAYRSLAANDDRPYGRRKLLATA